LETRLSDRFDPAPRVESVDMYGLLPNEQTAAMDAIVTTQEEFPVVLVNGLAACVGDIDVEAILSAVEAAREDDTEAEAAADAVGTNSQEDVMTDPNDIKQAVRERYAGHATSGTSCCGGGASTGQSASCGCGTDTAVALPTLGSSEVLGYDAADLAAIPDGADLGLGCGNPLALLELREGETVLDLGSGGGIDCFLAARRVGPTGHVIGVDMTPEMLERARRNASEGGIENVEFRLGEIEHLPVADGTVDAIISNCVVNLVPDKAQVFRDAYRVLKPGGRLSVSDIVVLGEIPVQLRESAEAYVACLSGAILRDDYLRLIREAGFADVTVTSEQSFEADDLVAEDLVAEFAKNAHATEAEVRETAALFQSVRVAARKPGD
jgi:arsenite methyltransferase